MSTRVDNQALPLRDYNLVAENRPLLEALRREGAGWAEESLLRLGEELGGERSSGPASQTSIRRHCGLTTGTATASTRCSSTRRGMR